MARRLSRCPEPPAARVSPHPGKTTRSWTVDVITPLWGGGAEPAVNDPITLVRAPSVRGHLRSAWRLTRGMHCRDAAALRAEEIAIWGAASTGSEVIAETIVLNQGAVVSYDAMGRDFA